MFEQQSDVQFCSNRLGIWMVLPATIPRQRLSNISLSHAYKRIHHGTGSAGDALRHGLVRALQGPRRQETYRVELNNVGNANKK